jgi:hypothetical protein
MKIRLIIFLILILGVACNHPPTQIVKETKPRINNVVDTTRINYNDLTSQDRSKYILNVSLLKIDSDSCREPVKKAYRLRAILQNLSDDTLKYLDYTCSHMIWRADNELLWVDQQTSSCLVCDANFITEFIVVPHGQEKIELLMEFNQDVKANVKNFRVGMILQRVIKQKDWNVYFKQFIKGDIAALSKQTQNSIWSNLIQIPD